MNHETYPQKQPDWREILDTLLSSLLDAISKHVNTDINANVNQKGTWSKVGVVILSNSQQSYIGLSIRVKNPHK